MLQRIRNVLQVTWRRCYNVSGTYWKLFGEDVPTYQERIESYLKKMLQHIRNVLKVTWRRCYNVSGKSCKLLKEDVTTYQERLASYLAKMLQRIRNVLKVTRLRCYNVSGTSGKLLGEDVTTYQERIDSYSKKMLPGTSCKLLEEDVTTYQEIVIDNADHRTLFDLPNPPKKTTMCKSDTSPWAPSSWISPWFVTYLPKIHLPKTSLDLWCHLLLGGSSHES
jgi:Txe/YoeB family toxin of Txe-Axe toxin-antitoxin module